MEGRILAGAGYFGSRDDPDSRVQIDEAQLNLRWNPATRQLQMPFDALSGPSRVSFMAQLDVPAEAGVALDARRSRAASWCSPPPTARAIRR